MKFKKLIDDVELPVLGLGTWKMGGDANNVDTRKDDQCIDAIKRAIEMGYTHIDTAEIYAKGHAEELVAEAIKDVDRKNIFITTKVWATNLGYEDVMAAAKKSLNRLQTDYIDLYLVHKPNPGIPIEETMKAMDKLVEEGLIKYIGVSNFSVEQMEEAQKHTKNKIVANQIEYNLAVRDEGKYTKNMESETIPYCTKNNITVIAWRPLALGKLSQATNNMVNELSEKYKKTQSQIAINWLISKENVVTIVKSTNIDHLKEDIDSVDWEMDKEDIRKLDKLTFSSFS